MRVDLLTVVASCDWGCAPVSVIVRSQTLLELVVVERPVESVALRNFTTLGAIAAHDGSQPRVSACVSKRGQHRHLRDMSQADDSATDDAFRC